MSCATSEGWTLKNPLRKSRHTVHADSNGTRVSLSYEGRKADEMAQLEAQQFADAARDLAQDKRIFHHGFRKLLSVSRYSVVYQRMSRIPDEDDRAGVLAQRINKNTFWLGLSTRTDLWLLSFYRKEEK